MTQKKTTKKVLPILTIDDLAQMAWKNEQKAKYNSWAQAGAAGTMKDEENPAYMFSTIPSSLLAMIVKGEIDARWLAAKALETRGHDKDGKWVGFDKATQIHGL